MRFKKIVAIIQARMGSSRLPGKILKDINGHTMLWHVVQRAKAVNGIHDVVVATSDKTEDTVVAAACKKLDVACFRGSETDVLDRYYKAASFFCADAIVRLTGDCPLLDVAVIDEVIAAFVVGDYDYVSNRMELTYPDGLDTEIFSFPSLEKAWHESLLPSEREHVTPYIYTHPEIFALGNVRYKEDLSALRWTVDEEQDLEFARNVFSYLGNDCFGMDKILEVLRTHPEITEINKSIPANFGYRKILQQAHLK